MYTELSKLHFTESHYIDFVKNMHAYTDAKMDNILARKRNVQAEKNNKQRQIEHLPSNTPNSARTRQSKPKTALNSKLMQGNWR